MNHLFIPAKLAKTAKQKGFNEPCLTMIDANGDVCLHLLRKNGWKNSKWQEGDSEWYAAPMYQQIIDWFRDEKKILIHQMLGFHNKHYCFKIQRWADDGTGNLDTIQEDDYYKALNGAIKEAFKLI